MDFNEIRHDAFLWVTSHPVHRTRTKPKKGRERRVPVVIFCAVVKMLDHTFFNTQVGVCVCVKQVQERRRPHVSMLLLMTTS